MEGGLDPVPEEYVAWGRGREPRTPVPVSYTHLRAHETVLDLVCRLLLEKKNTLGLDDLFTLNSTTLTNLTSMPFTKAKYHVNAYENNQP